MIKIVYGNLLDAKEDIICHQVNCQGVMGAGVAKAIRTKWPNVYHNYKEYCYDHGARYLMGTCLLVPINEGDQAVVNMFAQNDYGYNGCRFTSYDAFYNCLEFIKETVSRHCSIAFPYGIGSGLGGGNWDIIYTMIHNVLDDREVVIYRLED